MDEATSQLLKEQKWEAALLLLERDLETEEVQDKNTIAYNIVVCLVKMGKWRKAQQRLREYGEYINPEEEDGLRKDILELKKAQESMPRKEKESPTKTKSDKGLISEVGWFKSNTKFSDVIGLDKVKRELKEKILGPMINPDVYRGYGAKLRSGVILFGPPGTGKTLLARAVAGETNANFLVMQIKKEGKMMIVRIPEFLSKWQGDSERNIRTIFEQARKNTPAIIFIDELDAVAQARGEVNEVMGGTMKTIINTLLVEMDGVENNNDGVFVIGATNMPWGIDTAFRRPGRFDKTIYVPPPNTKERMALFKYYMEKVNNKTKIDYMKLGLLSFGMTPADIADICNKASDRAAADVVFNKKEGKPIGTYDLLKQIKEHGRPLLWEWYSNTLQELRKMPPETGNQYKELKKDIQFWYDRAKQVSMAFNIIGAIV